MMEWVISIATLLLAFLGLPLFAVFGGASMALFAASGDGQGDGLSSIYWAGNEFFTHKFADSNLTVTIPLFIFAGYLLAESRAPARLVRVSEAVLGWLPGGLPIVCIVASAFFTTFTGGSGITIVAVGGLLLPALLSVEYEERFSLGLVTAGGSLGLLFPPSVPLILYAIVAGVELTQLFVAGLLPGILTLSVLGAYSFVVGLRNPRAPKKFSAREAGSALWAAKWELMLPLVIVAGLLTGALRIHEAAAFAATYVLVIEVFVYRDIGITTDLPRIVKDSTTMFGAILIILATAIGFTGYLIDARIPDAIIHALAGVIDSPLMFLLILNLFLLLVGMLMDVFSAIVVVVPLIVPIAEALGRENPENAINPYHLGIVFLLNLEIGYLTPPVGLNLFISSLRFERPVTLLYRSVLPFVGLLILALGVVTYVPWLSTVLLVEDEPRIDLRETPGPSSPERGEGGAITLDDLLGEEDEPLTLDELEAAEGLGD